MMRRIEEKATDLISSNGSPSRSHMDTYLSSVSFWAPEFIKQSAWIDHAPFAFWLMQTHRPRTFVELGTHGGYSYFAFCQAVKALELDTRCYGVDHWKGDEHAGFYGEEVFERVQDYNERHYAAFSRLVRSTFDEALAHFSDGSVDLLHIDGRHFYEDVKHDFEGWRSKLSDRAVVLFHDTNVRERNFGVARLWEELRADFSAFEFLHGHGLGVLGYGSALPEQIKPFFDATSDPNVASEVRTVYGSLGVSLKTDFIHRQTHAQVTARLKEQETQAEELNAKLETRNAELAAAKARVQELESELAAIRASTSWRITAPARSVLGRVPRTTRLLRRLLKLAWWTVTLQLPRRLGERQRRRKDLRLVAASGRQPTRGGEIDAEVDITQIFIKKQREARRNYVIVAADTLPMFDWHSGGLRLTNIIKILRGMGCRIEFASHFELVEYASLVPSVQERIRYENALKAIGVERIAYGRTAVEDVLRATGAQLRFAFLSFPTVANELIPLVRYHAPWATILYDMVDFHALRLEREARLKSDKQLQAEADRLRVVEIANLRLSDITIAISEDEKSAMLQLVPDAVVHVIPNIFEMPTLPLENLSNREGLLFVGGFLHRPNIDAVCWFVHQVWPLIRQERPNLIFRVAGSNPSKEILALNGIHGIEVVGFTPDLTDLFQRSRVFVAPLRYGAGMKGKVGQSMAYGLPVVTTSIGVEGMQARDGQDILIADSVETLACAVLRISDDDALWRQLRINGRELIERTQSMSRVRQNMEALLHV